MDYEASQNAGLYRDDDDLSNFFALEPEAASIYYYNSPNAIHGLEKLEGNFIICDLGGGTVDIVTQKLEKTKKGLKIKELYPPMGGNNGCNTFKVNLFSFTILAFGYNRFVKKF